MARRADHTRDELKDLAISAGLQLIKKQGFSHFSARRVASDIGYTVGTLYNVFGSLDDFILHINAHTLDEWYAAMQQALESSKAKNRLHVLAQAYTNYSQAHYQQWIALFEHHSERDLPAWYMAKMERMFDLLEQMLAPLMPGKQKKVKQAARVLWAGIHGICILSRSGKLDLVDAGSPETLTISLIDNYLAGLAL